MTDETQQSHAAQPQDYTYEELTEWPLDKLGELDAKKLVSSSPAMVADFLERLDVDDRRVALRKLAYEDASEILAEMDEEDAAEVFAAMRENRAVEILEDFDPDDAADVVAELDDADRDRLLSGLEPETAEEIKSLMAFGPETAGGVMTPDVAMLKESDTVETAIAKVRELSEDREDLHHVYVVDDHGRLTGSCSLRRLLLAKTTEHMGKLMRAPLRAVCSPDTDREDVARLMAEYNLSGVAVADERGKLIGEVTHDDVIDILQDEATEDIQKLHGAGGDESVHDELSYSVRKRGPWLLVNLVTAFVAGWVVLRFEAQIGKLPLLAAFMPVIAGLGGNAGHQALAVAIRSIALGEVRDSDRRVICVKELTLGLINGIGIGLIASAIAIAMSGGALKVGMVVMLAMVLNMGLAGLVGALIPLLLEKLKFDPAQSSSIFLTAITDTAGFFIFLTLGQWLLLGE